MKLRANELNLATKEERSGRHAPAVDVGYHWRGRLILNWSSL
jgi:hypothetical protein